MGAALAGVAAAGVAALLLGATGWASWLLAWRLLPSAGTSERAAGACVVAYGGLYGLFCFLLFAHAFRWWIAIPAALALAGVVHAALARRTAAREAWRRDVERARQAAAGFARSPWGLALAGAGLLGLVRVARGMVLPPMGWDALVYHLFKAARWVQLGHHSVAAAPDIWGLYEYFPGAGSSYWAWALLPARDGMLLALAGGIVWLTIAAGAYAAARRLGASESGATAGALLLACVPAVAAEMTVSYVDNTMLAVFVLALVFFPAWRDPSRSGAAAAAALTGIALGLGAGVKASLLPILALGMLVACVRMVRPRGPLARRALVAASFGTPAAALFFAEYLATWRAKGSPLYPLSLSLMGHVFAQGNAHLMDVLAGRGPTLDVSAYPWYTSLKWMFLPLRVPQSSFSGFGPGAVLVLGMAAVGLFGAIRDRRLRAAAAVPLLAAGVLALGAFSPETAALRTLWASVFSRHVTPIFAVAVLFASLARGRSAALAWAAALTTSLALALPLGWASADLAALTALVLAVAIPAAVAAAVAFLPWPGRNLRPGLRRFVAAALVVVPLFAALPGIRAAARYPIWRSALETEGGAYDFHFLDQYALAAWPVWQRLDSPVPKRIAVTCGWDGRGQSWYLYPLMGSRLQNHLVYVPPTIDGGIVDYQDVAELNRRVQLRAWLRRLLDSRIDHVVTLQPSPPERLSWIVRLPDVFVPEMGDDASDTWLYRLDRDAAARLLETR